MTIPRKRVLSSLVARKREVPTEEILSLSGIFDAFCLTIGSCFSVQEARVALGYHLGQLLRFFRALQTSGVLHNSIVHSLKHEPIVL